MIEKKLSVRHPVVDFTICGKIDCRDILITNIRINPPENACSKVKIDSDVSPLRNTAEQIVAYLNGTVTDLSELMLDFTETTQFQQSVLFAARNIPYGTTVSYSRLAEIAGYPTAVRAAASVMRNNRFPLVIPCHRVIQKSGNIGGYSGSKTGKEIVIKNKLLEIERDVIRKT